MSPSDMVAASPRVRPVDLEHSFSVDRADLPVELRPPSDDDLFGHRIIRGLTFLFGARHHTNAILLDRSVVSIPVEGLASYVLVVHVASDAPDAYRAGLADSDAHGLTLGTHVSDYSIQYADGSATTTPIYRRLSIQQGRYTWGADPAAATVARDDVLHRRVADQIRLSGSSPITFGEGEVQHRSARDASFARSFPGESVWIYAFPNPSPEKPLASVDLAAREQPSAVYAISLACLEHHPLRPGVRRTLRIRVPPDARFNELGEMEDIFVDLGHVLSARRLRCYDTQDWHAGGAECLPRQSSDELLVELAAHPEAYLHIGSGENTTVHDLANPGTEAIEVGGPQRPVRLRVVDRDIHAPVPVRLHIHGEAGQYLPPRGHHRSVNPEWFEDFYAEYVLADHQYAYIDGDCIVDLPIGTVYVELQRGYEIAPVRTTAEVTAETEELVFELERVLDWRREGWVTADTHVHFLSPQTALLEGRAEDVNVVNLLASQWGQMFSNVGDFDGRTTFGARELGGDGDFVVRVGTENRMQHLGHISLLGYVGRMIDPLCTGGPSESALGDALEVSMADWAQRCRDQLGLTVMPHAPVPQLERAADIVLGLVDANEVLSMNPRGEGLNPYGVADWYRYLNLGYQIPIVGGSDKMSASMLLGGVRTYAKLGEQSFTYDAWMEAIRAGDTFATLGPLASIAVEGVRPGGRLSLPASGGEVSVAWRVESVATPVQRIEIVRGGQVAEDIRVADPCRAQGHITLAIQNSTWLALRVRCRLGDLDDQVGAHTSAVFILVDNSPLFSAVDAAEVLDQIQGAIAYVDTLAPRSRASDLIRVRASLERAYRELHDAMHRAGHYHRHPLHDPAQPHEH